MKPWRQVVIRPAVAGAAISVAALLGSCGDTVVVVQAPTTTNPAATVPTTDTESTPVGESGTGQVYLRPVLVDDQFNVPCVPVGPPGAATTTSIAGGSTAVPDVPPDQSGYVPSRGGGTCKVGPAGGTGDVFSDAQASQIAGSGWGVTATLRPGSAGEDVWNALAAECFNASATCPTRQLAIVFDGVVVSAPTVQQAEFSGTVQIAGDFTESEAQRLAAVLNGGA